MLESITSEHIDQKKIDNHGDTDNKQESLYNLKYSIKSDKDHQSSINSIKVSPDGKTFATCSSDTTIKIFNLSSGDLITELTGHTKGISDIEYSPINSNIIASCSDDLTIRLWSILKKKCIKILKKHTYHVTTIKFISKGNILISGSADETVTIWDLSSGKSLKTLAAHSDPVSSISITPDNTIIVSSSYDGLMRFFDLETGQCLKTLVYNSANHGTATASTSNVVNFPISNVELSPNGKYVLSSSLDGKIRLWDYMDNKVIKTYLGENGSTICEKYNCPTKFITKTDNPVIVSGTDSSGLLFWDVQTKQIVFQINDHTKKDDDSAILGIDIYNDGELLLSCSNKGDIFIYELNPSSIITSTLASKPDSLPDSPK